MLLSATADVRILFAASAGPVASLGPLLVILVLVGLLALGTAMLGIGALHGRPTGTGLASERHAGLLEGGLEQLGVQLAANRSEKRLDFREVHLLHVLLVGDQLGLVIGEHLGRHTADHRLRVVVVILILISRAGLVGSSPATGVVVRVRVPSPVAVVSFRVALALTLTLALGRRVRIIVVVLARFARVALLVLGVGFAVGAGAVSTGGGLRVGGHCARRLKSRLRGGLAARVDLREVNGLGCFRWLHLLFVAGGGVVHNLLPVYGLPCRLFLSAAGGRRGWCAGLRRGLAGLIDGLALLLFVRFLSHLSFVGALGL